jgi:ArsR family transcriptional regulator
VRSIRNAGLLSAGAKDFSSPLFGLSLSAYADIFVCMKTTTRLFKALSDETRLRILALLQAGELCVCDLMAILDLPQSTVSRHLAYLRNAGLVDDRRQGVWMFYGLTDGHASFAREILVALQKRFDQLPQVQKDRVALQKRSVCRADDACR